MDVNGKTKIVVTGITDMGEYPSITIDIDIKIHDKYIDITIKVDHPFRFGKWDDHPFSVINFNATKNIYVNSYSNRITKTRSTLTLLSELLTPVPIHINHTTDCTHRGQIIAALDHFWD